MTKDALMKKFLNADQRWQRALARWDLLGFWTKVYALAEHLMIEAEKQGRYLSGDSAYAVAKSKIEAGPLFGDYLAAS